MPLDISNDATNDSDADTQNNSNCETNVSTIDTTIENTNSVNVNDKPTTAVADTSLAALSSSLTVSYNNVAAKQIDSLLKYYILVTCS